MNKLILFICLFIPSACQAAFIPKGDFKECAMVSIPAPELHDPLLRSLEQPAAPDLLSRTEGPRIRVVVSDANKYRRGLGLIIAGACCMAVGGAIFAYGATYENKRNNADSSGTMAALAGALLGLAGLFALIGPGVYLRIRYRPKSSYHST